MVTVEDAQLADRKNVVNMFMHLTPQLNNFTFLSNPYTQIYNGFMESRFQQSYANIYVRVL